MVRTGGKEEGGLGQLARRRTFGAGDKENRPGRPPMRRMGQ